MIAALVVGVDIHNMVVLRAYMLYLRWGLIIYLYALLLFFRMNLTIAFYPDQVIYGDNPSLGLHSPYGFSNQMAYGQYSPASTPVPQIMVDNQIFSPQQIPVSPQYYPQPVGSSMPHMSAAMPVSHAEMVSHKGTVLKFFYSTQAHHSKKNLIVLITIELFITGHMSMNTHHGFYNIHGMFGSGEHLSSPSNSADVGWRTMNSSAAYSQPVGTLGSFDPTVGQVGGLPSF